MGLPNTVNQLFNGGSPYYIVNRSLRFRSSASAYLNRTPSVAGNRQKWTWSGWVKRGTLSTAQWIFDGFQDANNFTAFFFNSDNTFGIQYVLAATSKVLKYTTQVFRDPGAWYHIIVSIDTTLASPAFNVYVNGVQVTAFGTNTNTVSQNEQLFINNTIAHNIARYGGAANYFDGYLAEVNFIDGQTLTPSSFGAFDTNGIWQPIRYAGTYGTNGFYLPFNNTTSTTTLVADASGNGNNWTPNNISLTAGTTYDSMLDSPTVSNASSNYAVLNPTQPSGGTYQAGNQQFLANTSGQWKTAVGTMFATSGKYYWEVTAVALPTAGYVWGGAASSTINLASSTYNGASALPIGGDTNGWGVGVSGGNIGKYYNGSFTTITAGTDSVGDVWMIAVDIDAAKIWFGRNGTWLGSGDPATGTNAAFTNLSGAIGPGVSAYLNTGATAGLNCGQRPFSYTPPSGYNALNTANLPAATISYGAPYMNAITYTGYGPLIPSGLGIPTKRNALNQNVSRSLRFRSSVNAYLSRTIGSPSQTTNTLSVWVKRGSTIGSAYNPILGCTATNSLLNFQFPSSALNDTIQFVDNNVSIMATNAVYRNPSDWVHVVFVWDTTNATQTDRLRLYVDGVRVTSFNYANYPALNATYSLFAASGNWQIGSRQFPGALYFDGYMAQFYYIDGQALTAASFGETNSDGVWVPKSYTGTYGTNGFYLPFNMNSNYGASTTGSGSVVNVNGSYTNLTLGTGDFTIETWVYLTSTSSVGVVDWRPTSTNGNYPTIYISGGTLYYYVNSSNVIASGSTIPTNTWTHIAVARSGTTTKMFINGTQTGTSWTDSTNYLGATNRPGFAGAGFNGTTNGFSGYYSNLRIVKGTAVYTSNFTVPTSPLTAISGTSLLTFNSDSIIDNSGNSVSLTVGGTSQAVQFAPFGFNFNSDQSGNSNNWTPNNISILSGTTYDSMIDSPTDYASAGNYAVLNPLYPQGATAVLSDGNLQSTTGSTGTKTKPSTIAVSSGQWYWEVTPTAGSAGADYHIGIANADFTTTAVLGSTSTEYSYAHTGVKRNNNTSTAYGATYTTNDIIGVALDLDGGTLTYYKNGVSQGQAFSGISGTYVAVAGDGSTAQTSTFVFNFGQSPFTYSAPSGYSAINTYNITAPSKTWFSSANNSGRGSATAYPDFVWIKSRSSAQNHSLNDTLRGPTLNLLSNATNAEAGASTMFNVNKYGLTLGNDASVNSSSYTDVMWGWQAGQGTTSTNTSGTITSTVSASASSGFSVVTYTGTGANGTIGHGLGVAPSMIIIKNRQAANSWVVYHVSTGNGNVMLLNSTNASTADSTAWNTTTPTSSVFSVGSGAAADTNQTSGGGQHVAYCFAAVRGYSAFGSYTGNGSSTDGPFIYTGFRPKFVLWKIASGGTGSWWISDSSINQYNVNSTSLLPNLTNGDYSFTTIDMLSNGFKLRNNNNDLNTNGYTYIYAAFAENPFQIARAR